MTKKEVNKFNFRLLEFEVLEHWSAVGVLWTRWTGVQELPGLRVEIWNISLKVDVKAMRINEFSPMERVQGEGPKRELFKERLDKRP